MLRLFCSLLISHSPESCLQQGREEEEKCNFRFIKTIIGCNCLYSFEYKKSLALAPLNGIELKLCEFIMRQSHEDTQLAV